MCRQEQDAKTFRTLTSNSFGHRTSAVSAICTGYGGVMAYPHLEDCSKQKWTENV